MTQPLATLPRAGTFHYRDAGLVTAVEFAEDSLDQLIILLTVKAAVAAISLETISEVKASDGHTLYSERVIIVKTTRGDEFKAAYGDVLLLLDGQPEIVTVLPAALFAALFKAGE